MKATYHWLKKYVEFSDSATQIADKLTNVGFEVEEIAPLVKPFSGVVVGKVETVEKHPNADKLSLCLVNNGKETLQVICGAPNVTAGQIVPFATVGAELPNGFKIKKAKIRGIESFGMICSKEELGFEEKSAGIWELENDLPLGTDFYTHLSKDQDYVYDFFITPNRPDCLSMVGISREIAAFSGNPLQYPPEQVNEDNSQKIEDLISIEIEDQHGCPRYAGRVIRGIRIGPSPAWMQHKLEAVGMRPINNIVDITNFVLMELGHPLHAFDLDEISGNKIIVRKSKKDEKFITLDDKERILPEDTVMICDAEKPVAIGGIMGGLNSEVKESTVDILLESAYFNPQRISVASKKLALKSEASHRFERGTDPNGVIRALNRAASLMSDIAGGTVVEGILDIYPKAITPEHIPLDPHHINRILGTDLTENKIKGKLTSIELKIDSNCVQIPTFRVDLKQPIDLVEEVARLVNYTNLPSKKVTEIPYENQQSSLERHLNFMREQMLGLGVQEAFTSSMIKYEEAEPFTDNELVRILNPVSDDMNTMRPSLFPSLLKALAHNINRHNKDLSLFEIGRVFNNYNNSDLPNQPYKLAMILTGSRYREGWNTPNNEVDFYDIKGYLEALIGKIFLDNSDIILYDRIKHFSAEQSVALQISGNKVGECGQISEQVLKVFGIKEKVFGFELNLDVIFQHLNLSRQYQPIPKFPFVERDLAFILNRSVTAGAVIEFIQKAAGDLLKEIEIFDIYRGEKLGDDKYSLAVRMRFQSLERTLNDIEVDEIFNRIITKVNHEFKSSLRE